MKRILIASLFSLAAAPVLASAYNDFPGGTTEQRWLRDRLVEAMEREEFQTLRTQWWRFDLPEGRKYPVMNLSFEEMPTGRP